LMNEVEEAPEQAEAAQGLGAAPSSGGLSGSQPASQSYAAKNVKIPDYFDELIRNPNFDAAKKVISVSADFRPNSGSVTVKLDSVVIKCTKILRFHPNSSYVPPALYLIAKAFNYKGKQTDYVYSRQKAAEFIRTFPDHELSPDAHLLLAENLIALKENEEAKRALSRTVDVALPRKRYDIVSKSLRYTADLAMQSGDLQGAIRPYLHAMMLVHDKEQNAQWQMEIATLNLITGHDADAAQAFRAVAKYDPDLFTEFMWKYGLGVAQRQLHQGAESKKQFQDLLDESSYTPWHGYVKIELATLLWVTGEQAEAADAYRTVDTSNNTMELGNRAAFEHGMRAMAAGDYSTARSKFERVRRTFVPYSKEAERYYSILTVGDNASREMITLEATVRKFNVGDTTAMNDTIPQRTPLVLDASQSLFGTTLPPAPMPALMKPRDTSAVTITRDSLQAMTHARDSMAAVAERKAGEKRRAQHDTTVNQLAVRYYDIGRMFFLLGKPDSMVSYYRRIVALGPKGDIMPTTLYSYALYLKEQGKEQALVDTLMQLVVTRFPKCRFNNAARLHLGLTEEERIDSAEAEYTSGERFWQIGNDSVAIARMRRVYILWPGSDYAPQALYATGFMYETIGSRYDSAKAYYQLLVQKYPNSEHAKRVKGLLAAVTVDTAKKESTAPPPNTGLDLKPQISPAPPGGPPPIPGAQQPGAAVSPGEEERPGAIPATSPAQRMDPMGRRSMMAPRGMVAPPPSDTLQPPKGVKP
jgi:TolA-binding protein